MTQGMLNMEPNLTEASCLKGERWVHFLWHRLVTCACLSAPGGIFHLRSKLQNYFFYKKWHFEITFVPLVRFWFCLVCSLWWPTDWGQEDWGQGDWGRGDWGQGDWTHLIEAMVDWGHGGLRPKLRSPKNIREGRKFPRNQSQAHSNLPFWKPESSLKKMPFSQVPQ